MPFRVPCLLMIVALFLSASSLTAVEPDETAKPTDADPQQIEFFEEHVRPLLVKHCYECHSAESKELKGGLALDSRAGWKQGGDSGPALLPGKVDESLLIEAVRYDGYEMPPSGKLAKHEIQVFEKWVRMGAPDPRSKAPAPKTATRTIDFDEARQFWAFQLPEPQRPPQVKNKSWPLGDIDRFILAALEEQGVGPVEEADRLTWLRRVTFDLTGLPPTQPQFEAFQQDSSPQAYRRVVDELLHSPHFGQHWGRHWLDVARYADSNGSDFNATYRNAWRYRDYVVNAFNADKPFNEFVREQIAGDLMPYENEDQRAEQVIATTFLMIGPKMLSERDKQKLTMDVVDEQIDSTGRAFLGLTLGCARCHDHKFDPIPTKDYYALAGIFSSTITLEGESQQYVSAWKEVPLPIEEDHAAALARHQQQKSQLDGQLKQAKKDLAAAEQQLALLDSSRQGIMVDDVDAKVVGQWKDSTFSPNYVGKGYIHDEKLGKGEKSITFTPQLPMSGKYEVRISYTGGSGRADNVPVVIRHAEGTQTIKLDQTKQPDIDKLFKSLGTFTFNQGNEGSVAISTEGTIGYVIADAVQFLPVEMELPKPDEKEAQQLAEARKAIEELKQRNKQLEAELKKLQADAPPPAPTAMAAREAPEIGDCQVCIRGDSKRRGEVVRRGFLQVASDGEPVVANKDQSGRLELADWMARNDNPLTARVIVNRIWSWLLGEGIVRSVDNFGHLGTQPTHPELLDTLAAEFVQSGWSVKQLIRRIVLSRTYRLSSKHSAVAYAADAENKLLWRAHRKRLPAEAIRDSMLAVAGRLDTSPGGSPVEGLPYLAINNSANAASSGKQEATQRRSLYLPIIRNDLPAFLTVFDFADPDVVTGHRDVTNVPAQALALLNSPFVKQAAGETAAKLLEQSDSTPERLTTAYLWILARTPQDEEVLRATQYLELVQKDADEKEAWSQLVQALLASTEFRMLD